MPNVDQADFTSPPGTPRPSGRLRVLHVESGRTYGGIQRMLVCLAEGHDQCPAMEHVFALCFQERVARELTALGAESAVTSGPARTP